MSSTKLQCCLLDFLFRLRLSFAVMAAFSYSSSPLSPTPRPPPRFLPLALFLPTLLLHPLLFAFTGGNGSGSFSMYSFFFSCRCISVTFSDSALGPHSLSPKKTVGAQTTTTRAGNYLFKSIKFLCPGIWRFSVIISGADWVNPYILEDICR